MRRTARTVRLAMPTGITGFGFHILDIPPGRDSTEPHFHYREDECIYILSGRGTALIGDEAFDVAAGDFLGYRKGGAGPWAAKRRRRCDALHRRGRARRHGYRGFSEQIQAHVSYQGPRLECGRSGEYRTACPSNLNCLFVDLSYLQRDVRYGADCVQALDDQRAVSVSPRKDGRLKALFPVCSAPMRGRFASTSRSIRTLS